MSEQNLPDSLKVETDGNLLLVVGALPAKRNALNDATIRLERIFTTLPSGLGAVILWERAIISAPG